MACIHKVCFLGNPKSVQTLTQVFPIFDLLRVASSVVLSKFVKMSSLYSQFFMYMIGSCPTNDSSNDDESLEALCRRRQNPESYFHRYSYVIDIPVLSLATNRTYANVYCAQCHSDAYQLAQWNISIKCNDNIEKLIFFLFFSLSYFLY